MALASLPVLLSLVIGGASVGVSHEHILTRTQCADLDSADVARAVRFLDDQLAQDGGAPVEVEILGCVASPPMIRFWCRMEAPVPFRAHFVVLLPDRDPDLPPDPGGEPPVQPHPDQPLLRPASKGIPAYDVDPGTVRDVVRAAMREGLREGSRPWIVTHVPHPCFSYWQVSSSRQTGPRTREVRELSFSGEEMALLGECTESIDGDLGLLDGDCGFPVLEGRLERSDCPDARWQIVTAVDRVILDGVTPELARQEGEEICVPVRFTGLHAACDRRGAEVVGPGS